MFWNRAIYYGLTILLETMSNRLEIIVWVWGLYDYLATNGIKKGREIISITLQY